MHATVKLLESNCAVHCFVLNYTIRLEGSLVPVQSNPPSNIPLCLCFVRSWSVGWMPIMPSSCLSSDSDRLDDRAEDGSSRVSRVNQSIVSPGVSKLHPLPHRHVSLTQSQKSLSNLDQILLDTYDPLLDPPLLPLHPLRMHQFTHPTNIPLQPTQPFLQLSHHTTLPTDQFHATLFDVRYSLAQFRKSSGRFTL